jgi:putative nucleotidyltransferase with HDIG domain
MNTVFALLLFVMDVNILGTDVFTATAAMFMTFCAGTTAAFVANGLKTRLASVMLALVVLIPTEIIIALMEILISGKEVTYLVFAYGAVGALLSVFAYMIILPVFEIMFAELTVFRLRELTSDQAKLIKKLKKEAFGTYNHSVVVAQLAEACASEIGENAELARAVAYYHDMGKLKDPQMFTENQTDFNVHDQLTPELSADIIRSHARDGATLIKKHRLPEIFADIAVQHHGTMPILFFYAKAKKFTDGEVDIAQYCYNGPKPQTKIAAIIMIADGCEAAVRTLQDRSREKVDELVRKIVGDRMKLGQFEECEITLKELNIIIHTVVNNLTGIYHSRIEYPKVGIDGTEE